MGVLKSNVFLVGFMGVGKTTVSRKLARMLGVAAIDVDRYLTRKHGNDANQLYQLHGEEGLRSVERLALQECAAMGPAIISCGEGIVESRENREVLRREGFAVMLESSEEDSLARIKSLRSRPLLAQGCNTQQLWEQRKPLYEEVAQAVVQVSEMNTYDVACRIKEILTERGLYEPADEEARESKVLRIVQ